MSLPTLEAARVRLRGLRESDTDAFFGLRSDPETMRYWSHLPYTERAQAQRYLAENAAPDDTALLWGIATPDTDTLIGTFTLFGIDRRSDRAEIGYLLGRPHWGQGLATEAATLAIDHAFGAMGLRRLEADIDPRNTASQRLLERLGFVREGILRERWRVGDEISDTAFYGMLAREWRERR